MVSAQDKIITTKGDTISCQITRISETHFHYITFDSDGKEVARSRIPQSDVSTYIQVEAREEDLIIEQSDKEQETVEPLFDEITDHAKTWRAAINGGYTYQFGGYEGFPKSYKRQLTSLFNIGADVHYFTNSSFGIGVKFNRISTRAQDSFPPNIQNIQDNLNITFIALSIMNRQLSSYDANILYYGVSVGRIAYRNSGIIDSFPIREEGNTIGVAVDIGYDISISPSMMAGIGFALNLSVLTDYTINGVSSTALLADPNFSLSRFDITAGLRFTK